MAIDNKLIDQLLTDYKKPEDIIGEKGLLKQLTKAILERALAAEMTDHLGYEKHDPAGHHRGNTRNGKSPKTLKGDFGELELETPRDRQVLTELRNRGVKDIFIACVDGLKGFPEAIAAVYPRTEVQLCIVHLVRASLNYVPWKSRKQVARDLRSIYRATTAAEAEQQLQELEGKWKTYPSVSQVWRRNWTCVIPFFNYPPDIRRAIYTTNSVESLNRSLRKIIKTRGEFPNEEAALKLLFLALR
jgi:transposase-like protein